jgi:hypothetical protein
MKKMFFGWSNIRTFFKEVMLTLTSKESRFSQKKLLIYIIDLTMLFASFLYMYNHRATMTPTDHCMIVGMWLAKGVSNVIMTQGDKKLANDADSNNPPVDTDKE